MRTSNWVASRSTARMHRAPARSHAQGANRTAIPIQLLWVLDTPLCDPGCDQIQPRLVQDIRGLRGSAPYHWDGIPGDVFGGVNSANIDRNLAPNCDGDVEESCTRHLIDGSLATTMCDLNDCETNDEGKPGTLDRRRTRCDGQVPVERARTRRRRSGRTPTQ